MAIEYYSSIDLNKNELQNAALQVLSTKPASPATGQIFFDSDVTQVQVYNGSAWQGLVTEVVDTDDIFNADLRIGRDSHNMLDFKTADNTIDIYLNNAKDFTFTANTFTAQSGSTIAAQALTATTGTFSGVLKTDNTTNATSTTDGSLQTDGGLSVALDAVIGDDLVLISDAAVLSLGAGKDVTITHDGGVGGTLASSGNFIIDSTAGFMTIDGHSALVLQSAGDIAIVAGGNDITMDTDHVIIESAATADPTLTLKSTTNSNVGSTLEFISDKGGVGADNDMIGSIKFIGDDYTQVQTQFARIVGSVSESANGEEAGKLEFFVAESNGTSTNPNTVGLLIEGEHATDGQIDVTIAAGDASTTTVAGTLTMGSTATINNSGVWVGGVIPSAKLDADTAHLDVAQTFGAAKTFGTDKKLLFRDSAIYLNSSTDGQLDIVADTEIQIAATTIDINGAVAAQVITGTTIDATTDFTIGNLVITDNTLTGTALSLAAGSGEIDLTTSGAVDINSGAFTIDGAGISIDGNDDSNFTVNGSGKDLSLDVSGGGAQQLSLNTAGTGTGALDINATAGGVDVDAVKDIALTTTGDTGEIQLISAHGEGRALFIDANVHAGSIVDIDAGILDVDVTGVASIDSSGTLSLGTANSGVAINIGHGTSLVTIGDNLTVTGDLTVNGTTTSVNSTTVDVADININLGNGVGNDAAVNGGGVTLESSQTSKTWNWIDATDSWTSNQHINIVSSGTDYKIAGTSVLNATTLGSAVVASSLTSVGVLNSGSINTSFGDINNGASAITTTGLISGGSLDIDNVLINGTTIGHTDDTDLMTVADGLLTVAGEVQMTTLDIGGTNVTATAAEINLIDGDTARGTTAVADGDGILTNDGGTMRMTNVQTFATYFGAEISSQRMVVADIVVASLTGDNIVTIPHNLGTADVMVQVYDKTTEANVICDIARTSEDFSTPTTEKISIDFGTPPPNDCRVLITSLASATASGTVTYA